MTRILPALMVLSLSITACTQKVATTPSRWFDEATLILQKQYYGHQKQRLQPLIENHQQHLKKLCYQTCSWNTAETELKNLLKDLADPHTFYRTPEQHKQDAGQQVALGIQLAFLKDQNAHLILRVKEDSPAAKAGLRRGDAILTVNGVPCTPEHETLLKTTIQQGQPFQGTVHRPGKGRWQLTLQGKQPAGGFMPALVTAGLPAGIGLLTVPDFDSWQKVSHSIHALIKTAQDARLNTLVLDLRGNPGGYVWEMLSSASAFMKQVDTVDAFPARKVHLVGWEGKVRQEGKLYLPFFYRAPTPHLWTGKLLVLVNPKTASAAESLAYTLQLQHRATVIGEPTQGLLNTTTQDHPLSNGGTLVVAITRTQQPSGAPYPERITPDLPIKDDLVALMQTGQDRMLQAALEVAQSGTPSP
ncbi:S41 family peptidase [Deinococcus roseus]|uniref:Protease n=1 Tax=Deinococcus roseus TaxID=392414 RepID=A0ABQ2D968_9DEIO|nr:S41 family peptidase [Deinococcus roseus]GGJ50171.1 protease [Deinococcus roseus]